MALSPEIINQILTFSPHEQIRDERGEADLGDVEGRTLAYLNQRYQQRLVCFPGEPKIDSFTVQPVVTVVTDEGSLPLAYATDVIALGDDLAAKVADRLNAINAGLRG